MFMMKAVLLLLAVLTCSAARELQRSSHHHHKHPHHHHHHAHHDFSSPDSVSSGYSLEEKLDDFDFNSHLRAELKDKDPQEDLREALEELSKVPFFNWFTNPLLLKPSPEDPEIQLSNKTAADINENQLTTTEQYTCHKDALFTAFLRCRASCSHEFDLLKIACDENGPKEVSPYTFFMVCCPKRLHEAASSSPSLSQKPRNNYPTEKVEKFLAEKYSSEEEK